MDSHSFEEPNSLTANSAVKLALVIHNHQPVGNFDGVIRDALDQSYRPFLRTLSEFPEIRVVLHHSGCLLDWLVDNGADYLDEVSEAVERGQIELLGGPMDEPILASIPRRDRIGQMRMHHARIQKIFGVDVQGVWVPERVWEHSFTADLASAGVQYTLLDDSHFHGAGVADAELSGSFVCEDEGRVIRVFPINERLRYIIPFHPVDEVIETVRTWGQQHPGGVVVFGDDGEKFGVWPGTQKSVFEEGWLRQFFSRLTEESSWLRTTTLSDAAQTEPPVGRVALPDTSYREMTEWVLPTALQKELVAQTRQRCDSDPGWSELKNFVRGGTWRNFLSKYPEAGDMAARMKEVSARVEIARREYPEREEQIRLATRALYRGQCNCPYWHGSFGGLYLSHLRQATYRNLIEADSIVASLDHESHGRGAWVELELHDFNFDFRPELKLSSDRIAAYVSPACGGQLYEFDVRGCGTNILATLARREEPYHEKLNVGETADEGRVKEAGLAELLQYDKQPRRALVDRFLPVDASLDGYRESNLEIGEFSNANYRATTRRDEKSVSCTLSHAGNVDEAEVRVTKSISVATRRPNELAIHYKLDSLVPGREYHFAVEFNIAGLAADAADRYLYDETGQRLGPVNAVLDVPFGDRIGAVDEWAGLDLAIDWNKPASFWSFPIETVSGSEGGIERTYQCTCIVPRWRFTADQNGVFEFDITLSCDTSAAQAKKLATVGALAAT